MVNTLYSTITHRASLTTSSFFVHSVLYWSDPETLYDLPVVLWSYRWSLLQTHRDLGWMNWFQERLPLEGIVHLSTLLVDYGAIIVCVIWLSFYRWYSYRIWVVCLEFLDLLACHSSCIDGPPSFYCVSVLVSGGLNSAIGTASARYAGDSRSESWER